MSDFATIKLKKLWGRLLALFMIFLLSAPVVTEAATIGEARLTSLGFTDNIVLDFDSGKYEYTAYVPWDETTKSYVNSSLTYTATEGADVVVSGGLEAGAYTVTVSGTTYTINLIKIGENKFYNGDFEGKAVESSNSMSPATPDGKVSGEGKSLRRIPEGWTNNVESLDRTAYGEPDEKYCVRTRVGSYTVALKPDSEHSVSLSKGSKYLYRDRRRDSGLATNGSQDVSNKASNDTQFVWYKADGSIETEPTPAPALWETNYAVVTPSTDISGFYSSVWGTLVDMLFDNMFIGELVVSRLSVTDEAARSVSEMLKPSGEDIKTITLAATRLNQLGNCAGLGSLDAQATSWSVAGNPAGISVQDGVVTISSDVSAGIYHIEAIADTGLEKQTQVKGVYTLRINENQSDAGSWQLYVAPDGNDGGRGTLASPFATIEGARNTIRKLRAQGLEDYAFTVYMRGGKYPVSKGIILEEQDSGSEEAPVVYRNYLDEEVNLVGGSVIDGNEFTRVEDADLLDRLVNQDIRDNLWCIDLKTKGITDVGSSYLRGVYSYTSEYLEGGYLTKPALPPVEVLYNGDCMTQARYPNVGDTEEFMRIAEVIESGHASENSNPSTPFVMRVTDDRVHNWTAAVANQTAKNKVMMHGYWTYDYADQSIPIKEINTGNNYITSTLRPVYEPRATMRFYVYNLLEELDIPGEYYLDYDNAVLYLCPLGDIEEAEVSLSLTKDTLITLMNTNYVTFSGINVLGARNGAFKIDGGSHNLIEESNISGTSYYAVNIRNTRSSGIQNSHIYDVNGGVILTGGDRKSLQDGNNFVKNCHIERFARLDKGYIPAVDLSGVGNVVSHNIIHDAPHMAIAFSGQNHKIIYNEFYDIVKECYDSGVIYGGLTWVGRGVEIKYNYFHDMDTSSRGGVGFCAVYMEVGQSDMEVSGNLFENINGGAIWLGGGSDVIMENNYIINCKYGLWLQKSMETIDLESVFYEKYDSADKTIDFATNEAWQENFPKLYEFMELSDDEKRLAQNNVFKNNLCYKTPLVLDSESDISKESIPDIKELNRNWDTDPGFVSLADRDYRLMEENEPNSVFSGFYQLPLDKMGHADIIYSEATGEIHTAKTGTLKAETIWKNNTGTALEINGFHVLYQKTANGLRMVSVYRKEASLLPGDVFTHNQSILVPDGNEYYIKSFVWRMDNQAPMIKAGSLSQY